MPEYIYIASNSKMPRLIKIGMTKNEDPYERIRQLGRPTGVPTRFVPELVVKSGGEKAAHHALRRYRLPKSEFFEIGVADAVEEILPVIGDYEIKYAKPPLDVEAVERELAERNPDIGLKLKQARVNYIQFDLANAEDVYRKRRGGCVN